MPSQREIKDALPVTIPFYSFSGDTVNFNDRKTTPGKNYMDPQDVLVRVYNATIAKDGGFSGEVIAIGDHIDSLGINDYVLGGGIPCLQQYITVRAEEVITKPRQLNFAEAARVHAGTIVHDALQSLQAKQAVLILGDMTGFAAQICRDKECLVTATEDFNCGELRIIHGDNFLTWLETHTYKYDVIVDATGDLDLYDYCHKFSHKHAEYISINPESSLQAVKSSMLPSFLGGGTRKLTIARAAKASRKAASLSSLTAKLVSKHYEVKQLKIVSYEGVKTVRPSMRYVTAVNVVKQSDLTPDVPDSEHKEGRASERRDKGKASSESRRTDRRPPASPSTPSKSPHGRTQSFDGLTSSPLYGSAGSGSRGPQSPASPGSPSMNNPYSPRQPSRLSQSVSASNLSDLVEASPSPPSSHGHFSPPQRVLSFGRDASPFLASSPKMTILARPEIARRHTSAISDEESPFEAIDLQSSTHTTPVVGSTTTPTLPESGNIGDGATEREDEGDTRTPAEVKEQELAQAKNQIEFLQKQVEALMRSQAAAGGSASEEPVQGLGLFSIE